MTETAIFAPRGNARWTRPSPLRALARVPYSAADLTRRGVMPADSERAATLELVAHRFLDGYNAMLDAEPLAQIEKLLGTTAPARHGFVVEGAAMGAAVRDGMSLRAGLLEALVARHGARFEYLMSVGVGWAIARMPWRSGQIQAAFDPLLLPLICDGRGFHDLFFAPRSAEIGAIRRYRGEAGRGYDAGLGRALWFVSSGHIPRLDMLINRFASARQPDILAGIGLAMAYAGPTTHQDWVALRASHGTHWAHVGQGVCFAAEAMARNQQMLEHTILACRAALGCDPNTAADIAAMTRPSDVDPARGAECYGMWRAAIRGRLSKLTSIPAEVP